MAVDSLSAAEASALSCEEEIVFASYRDRLLNTLSALFKSTCAMEAFPRFLGIYDELFQSIKASRALCIKWLKMQTSAFLLAHFSSLLKEQSVAFFQHHASHFLSCPENRLSSPGLLREAIDRMRTLELLAIFEPLFMKWIFEYYARVILGEDSKASAFPLASPSISCCLAFSVSYYRISSEWMERSLKPFLAHIECSAWLSGIESAVISRLGSTRAAQLFSLITEFPQSLPAIEDLHRILPLLPGLRDMLIQSLGQCLQRHFLSHASTMSTNVALNRRMIQFLIHAMLSLYYLDSTGYILEATLSPLTQCLKRVPCTMKTVASVLLAMNQGPDEMHCAVSPFHPHIVESRCSVKGQTYIVPGLEWEPEWIQDTDVKISDYFKRGSIVECLVACCKSKLLLFEEVQRRFGDLLLFSHRSGRSLLTARLESLKDLFGSAALQACDVMLRDMYDSIEYTHSLVPRPASALGESEIEIVLLSHLYWSNIERDEAACTLIASLLPPRLCQQLDVIAASYATLKTGRSIDWCPEIGSVDLLLDFEDGSSKSYSGLLPIDASVVLAFQSMAEHSLESLYVMMTELPLEETLSLETQSLLKGALDRWVERGILKTDDQTGRYHLLE